MPQIRKTDKVIEARTTRSRSKNLHKAEITLAQEQPPFSIDFHNNKKSYAKNNGLLFNKVQTCVENNKQIKNHSLLVTKRTHNKENGSLCTENGQDENCFKKSRKPWFYNHFLESILYLYLFLALVSHQLVLHYKSYNSFNVNYLIIGLTMWNLMLGTIADFVSLKAVYILKSSAWLVCLLFSFTIYEEIAGVLIRILLSSSLLVVQISSCYLLNSTTALARMSAVRCLLEHHRLSIVSIMDRVRIIVWDVGSCYAGVSSFWAVHQFILLCSTGGAILCLIYLSTRSTILWRDLHKDDNDNLRTCLAVPVICKICLTLPCVLFFSNAKGLNSNTINISAIGVQLVVFPLLSYGVSYPHLSKICFLLLAIFYSITFCYSSVSSAYATLLGTIMVVVQCAIIARAALCQQPAIGLSLMVVVHLLLRTFADSMQQSGLNYYVKQFRVSNYWSDVGNDFEIGFLGVSLSLIGLLVLLIY